MAALAADPPAAQVPAAGGVSTHQLVNSGAARLAFKVKSSNNNEYRMKPVFGFVEPGASSPLEITRLAGAPKEDKFVVQFAEVPADCTDPQAPFKAGGQQGEVTIPVKAEVFASFVLVMLLVYGSYARETSTTPPRSPKSNESNGSPVNLPEIIIEDHKVIYDSEPLLAFVKDLLNGPPLPLKTVDGVRYAPLQRFHMAFNQHLFDGERPTVISDVKFMKLTMIMREMENVIQRSAKFLMSCEEFVELPKNDKWRLYRQFTSNVMCIVRAVATVEFFGCDLEDKRIMYTEDSCIFSDNVDYDTEQISPSTAETLRNVFRPLCTNLYKKVVSPCKQLQITKFETAYILAAILWNTDEIDDVSVETQEAADRFMSEAASEMHHYYRFEMKMENYAERLSKLIKMINAIEKIATQRREMFTLLNMFDMFSCSLFKSDTFF